MVDREFLDGLACSMHQHGQEPMPTVEGKDALQRFPSEYTQEAAGVLKVDSQGETPSATRDACGEESHPVVTSLHSHTTNEVGVLQFGEEARQVGRIILPITIESSDGRGGGGVEPG